MSPERGVLAMDAPKQPTYGVTGSRKQEDCAGHALQGMVNISRKRCAGDGCTKHPTYGVTGSRKPEYCAEHALQGIVNVVSKRCAGDGCTKNRTMA